MFKKSYNDTNVCSICGKEKEIYAKGRCLSCYNKMRRYGVETAEELNECLKNNKRGQAEKKRQNSAAMEPKRKTSNRGRKPGTTKHTDKCRVCGEVGVMCRGLCSKCYRISLRYKIDTPDEILAIKNKPSYMRNRKYDLHEKCAVCGHEGIYSKGLCRKCYCTLPEVRNMDDKERKKYLNKKQNMTITTPRAMVSKEPGYF